jgi:hypothetical protein
MPLALLMMLEKARRSTLRDISSRALGMIWARETARHEDQQPQ